MPAVSSDTWLPGDAKQMLAKLAQLVSWAWQRIADACHRCWSGLQMHSRKGLEMPSFKFMHPVLARQLICKPACMHAVYTNFA